MTPGRRPSARRRLPPPGPRAALHHGVAYTITSSTSGCPTRSGAAHGPTSTSRRDGCSTARSGSRTAVAITRSPMWSQRTNSTRGCGGVATPGRPRTMRGASPPSAAPPPTAAPPLRRPPLPATHPPPNPPPSPPPLDVSREPAPAVGRLQEQRSAALQLRPQGDQERFRLGKVLDHVEEHDRVERSLVRHDRERFEPHVDPVTCVRLLGRAAVELRADHVPAIIAKRRQHCAIRRPDLQQTTAR